MYDPKLGRFTAEDPIGFEGGDVNLYGYVSNRPTMFRDPSGRIAVPVVLVAAWAIIEGGFTAYDAYSFAGSITDPCADPWDVALGGGGLLIGAIAPGGGYGTGLKGGKGLFFSGRRGGGPTRDHLEFARDRFRADYPDAKHTGGGRNPFSGDELPEEYIPNPNGGRKGGAYADLTFEMPDGSRFRVNTVDTYANNSPTNRELENAYRIYEHTGEPIFLIPKPKSR